MTPSLLLAVLLTPAAPAAAQAPTLEECYAQARISRSIQTVQNADCTEVLVAARKAGTVYWSEMNQDYIAWRRTEPDKNIPTDLKACLDQVGKDKKFVDLAMAAHDPECGPKVRAAGAHSSYRFDRSTGEMIWLDPDRAANAPAYRDCQGTLKGEGLQRDDQYYGDKAKLTGSRARLDQCLDIAVAHDKIDEKSCAHVGEAQDSDALLISLCNHSMRREIERIGSAEQFWTNRDCTKTDDQQKCEAAKKLMLSQLAAKKGADTPEAIRQRIYAAAGLQDALPNPIKNEQVQQLLASHFPNDPRATLWFQKNPEKASAMAKAFAACADKKEAALKECETAAVKPFNEATEDLRRWGDLIAKANVYQQSLDRIYGGEKGIEVREIMRAMMKRQGDGSVMQQNFEGNLAKWCAGKNEKECTTRFLSNYGGLVSGKPYSELGRNYLLTACRSVAADKTVERTKDGALADLCDKSPLVKKERAAGSAGEIPTPQLGVVPPKATQGQTRPPLVANVPVKVPTAVPVPAEADKAMLEFLTKEADGVPLAILGRSHGTREFSDYTKAHPQTKPNYEYRVVCVQKNSAAFCPNCDPQPGRRNASDAPAGCEMLLLEGAFPK